ncbi:MAG: hypothetical protein P8X82_17625, partial [Gemmatimonadales bacterium]
YSFLDGSNEALGVGGGGNGESHGALGLLREGEEHGRSLLPPPPTPRASLEPSTKEYGLWTATSS